MSSDVLSAFLLNCLVINVVLLVLYFLILMLAHDWIYKIHGRWFDLSVSQFDAIHYSLLAAYKTATIFFVVIPYIALRMSP